MTLDLNKPMRRTFDGKPVQFLYKLKKREEIALKLGILYVVIVTDSNDEETCYVYSEAQLENIPQSRWLNVYVDLGRSVNPVWYSTREFADSGKGTGRVAVIEDKQDGSPWILHQL